MSSIPACQLNCLNGGYCNYISSDEATLIDTFARGGLIQKCICPPQYGGLSCENKIEQCSEDLKCHNGVPCALDEETGKYYCDCSYGDKISKFAGKMCREPATSYCGQGDIKNRSFCTNGGLCESNIYRGVHFDQSSEYSTHKGCACPPEFEGVHCEFLRDVPADTSEPQELELELEQEHQEEEVPEEESTEQIDQNENETFTEDAAIATQTPPVEAESVSPLDHSKESNEAELPESDEEELPMNEAGIPVTNENVEAIHDKTPPIKDSPVPDSTPPVDLGSATSKTPPVPDNTMIDLESVPKESTPMQTIMDQSNKGSAAEANKLGGSMIALMSLTGVALIVGLLAHRRMRRRKRQHIRRENHFVLGDNYKDETPIRVQVLSELEQPNELDEVLGLDGGNVEYEDEDEMMMERSECSLEEIELEHPTNEGDEEDEFGDSIRQSDSNPFAHIIGPLLRSERNDGIV